MLLPREEDENGEEIDPREELVEQLLEYKMVRSLSEELIMLQKNAEDVFYRSPSIPKDVLEYEEPVDTTELMKDVTLKKLESIFAGVLRRKEDRRDPIRARFGDIPKEEVPLEKKMAYVKDYIHTHKSCSFKALLSEQSDKTEVIVAFLSILELMKTGEIVVVQEHTFDDITISAK